LEKVEIRKATATTHWLSFAFNAGMSGTWIPNASRAIDGFAAGGAVTRTVRLIWREGYPPDNVVTLPTAVSSR
jgi:hypothetical protein